MSRKILLHHGRSVGDVLMLTAGVRDFKLLFPKISINTETCFPELFNDNPYVDKTITRKTPGVEYYNVGYPQIQHCNGGIIHFTQSFLLNIITQVDLIESLGMELNEFTAAFSNGRISGSSDNDPLDNSELFKDLCQKYKKFNNVFCRKRADIYLSEHEKTHNMIKENFYVDKYWVISFGKNDCTTKIWDFRRFQDVIDHFAVYGIKFVIIGKRSHVTYKLNNVIDLIDKTTLRDVISIVYHSEGSISGVSMLMHMAAAIPRKDGFYGRPHVAIYGGREPLSFTAYEHQILHTVNTMTCCDNNSGCMKSQVVPSGRDEKETLCTRPIISDGKTIQTCMDKITPDDIIRSMMRYYDGGALELPRIVAQRIETDIKVSHEQTKIVSKEINMLASLQSAGGGEQSAIMIATVLRNAGWKVNFFPWDKVHGNYIDQCFEYEKHSAVGDMARIMKPGLPLLFYANDQINAFCSSLSDRSKIVEKSACIIIGINYINGILPKATWLQYKTKAILFQNNDRKEDFIKQSFWTKPVELSIQVGAIDMQKLLEVPIKRRQAGKGLVILKHGMPDYRKYTTEQSKDIGDKKWQWQRDFHHETDIKFYERMIKDVKGIRFEFMEAHKEVYEHFKDFQQFTFYKFNQIPVDEFLSHGHVYLHRTSAAWSDNYPRSIAEAQAVGLPVLCEPRDGGLDRVRHGHTGFHCVDYDGYVYAVKLLQRKENYRFNLAKICKKHAQYNYDPQQWVDTIERILL
jgi:ADP-heptose:LPS heptosyltransferase